MSSTAVPRCIVCNSAVAIAAKCRVIHPCSEVSRSSMWLHDAISLGCSVSRLLTRHNQEITQWSPDPFPRERVESGHETSLVQNDTHVMHMSIDPTLSLSMQPTTQLRHAPSDDHHLSSSNNLLKSSVSQNYVLL